MQNNIRISRKVYVIGPTKSSNNLAKKKRINTLHTVCKRILVAKFVPVCPMIYCHDWIESLNLPKDPKWWIENIFSEYIKDCIICCYVPSLTGQLDPFYEAERNLWRTEGNGEFVVADMILEHLLKMRANR